MGLYAKSADVEARVPYRPALTSDSDPSVEMVDQWIKEAEAKMNGRLRSVGIGLPITDTDGVEILRMWITDYAEGRLRKSYAAAGGDADNEDGQELIDRFDETLNTIANDWAGTAAMLNAGGASDSNRVIRGNVLDNADGKTISGGDFAPEFQKAERADQY